MLAFYGQLELLMNSQNCKYKSTDAKHLLFFGFSETSSLPPCALSLCWEAGGFSSLGKEGNACSSGNSSSSSPLLNSLHSRVCVNSKAMGISAASGLECCALMKSLIELSGLVKKWVFLSQKNRVVLEAIACSLSLHSPMLLSGNQRPHFPWLVHSTFGT